MSLRVNPRDLDQAFQAQRPDSTHGARLALGEECRQIGLYFSAAADEASLFPVASHLSNHRLAGEGA